MLDIARLGMQVDSSQAKAAAGDLDNLAKKAGPAEKAVKGVGTAGTAASSGMSKFSKSVVATVAGMATLTAAMALARKAIGVALPFDAALAEASTLIEGTTQQIDFLRNASRSMAGEFGGNATTQVQAFYQAISAGASTVEEASDLLRVANVTAKGGVTDLVTSVDVLTTSVNSYGKDVLSAADAADILFTGVKAGKTTMGELGGTLGNVTSIAAQAGLSFEELVSGVAALTAGGLKTSVAVTGMRAIIASLLKPSSEAVKLSEKLGIEFSAAGLRAKGFSGFMADLVEKTGGSQEAIATLFGGVEALGPILAFAGTAGDKFNETMSAMAVRSGAAQEAADKIAASLSDRLNVALGKAGLVTLSLGDTLLVVLVPAIELVTNNIELLGTALAVLAATQIPRLVTMAASGATALLSMAAAAGGATTAIGVLKGAMVLLGGPLGLIAAALALVWANADRLTGVFGRIFGSGRDAVKQMETATDNLVLAQGDEIKQTQILGSIIASGNVITVQEAEAHLQSAEAIYKVIAAKVENARVTAELLKAEQVARLKQFQDTLPDRSQGGGALQAAAEAERAAALSGDIEKVQETIRLINAELAQFEKMSHFGEAADNVAKLKEGLANAKDGLVTFLGVIDPVSASTRKTAEAATEAARAINSEKDALERTKPVIEETVVATETLANKIDEMTFDNFGNSLSNFVQTGKLDVRSLADSIISDLIRVNLQFLKTQLFNGSGGGSGFFGAIASGIASLIPSSAGRNTGGGLGGHASVDGNVFSGGNIVPFRKGGVINDPTIFRMANGGLASVAEEKPEGILPLGRTSDGKLGVHGSTGPGVVVQIINNTPSSVREERSTGPRGQDIRKFIIDEVRNGFGRGEFDQPQRSRFGVQPQKVKR